MKTICWYCKQPLYFSEMETIRISIEIGTIKTEQSIQLHENRCLEPTKKYFNTIQKKIIGYYR